MLGADWHKAKGAEVDGGDLTAFLGGDMDRTTARRCRYTVYWTALKRLDLAISGSMGLRSRALD
jgi:hypothetical protein